MLNIAVQANGTSDGERFGSRRVAETSSMTSGRPNEAAILRELTRIRSMVHLLTAASTTIANKQQAAAFAAGFDAAEFLLDRVADEMEFRRSDFGGCSQKSAVNYLLDAGQVRNSGPTMAPIMSALVGGDSIIETAVERLIALFDIVDTDSDLYNAEKQPDAEDDIEEDYRSSY